MVDRLFGESLGAFHMLCVYPGDRLGLFGARQDRAADRLGVGRPDRARRQVRPGLGPAEATAGLLTPDGELDDGRVGPGTSGNGSHRMPVEPMAGESLADNVNQVGRIFYSVAPFICTPGAQVQPGGYALGNQVPDSSWQELLTGAGFRRFRRATETPFNRVFEVRP